jgi:hypothetical protein
VSCKLDAALQYAARGWSVFPAHSWISGCCTCDDPACDSPAKHPLTPNGCKDATASTEQIVQWWTETQGLANVAVATGAPSGLVVLDVDPKSDGLTTLAGLEEKHGKLPTTPTVQTGSGGRHYYFRSHAAVKIGNRAGVLPGIDVRGDGGYVIAPPSDHASGSPYSWLVPPSAAIAEIPDWLLGMIQHPKVTDGMVLKLTDTLDLATAPVAAKGKRHDTLCRLVGAHLGRGEKPDAILPLARAWANRCTPPLPDAEVVSVVQTLGKKHQSAALITHQPDPVDTVPLPAETPWPHLDEAALHGPVGELVRLVEPCSEADPAGLLLTALVALGNCIGRQPTFTVEGNGHHVNLFVVLVGESSRARKGTSLGRIMSLFDRIDPEWRKHRVLSGLSSGEGLIWVVRDPIEGIEAAKDKDGGAGYRAVVKDPGVEDKRLLVNESEFAQALRGLRREGNTLSPIIRQAWDEGDMKALTKNSPAQATDAHVSILGHITRPELTKYLDDTDIFNGFANRFLWAVVRRSKLLPDGGAEVDLSPVKLALAKSVTTAKQIAALSRSPDARSLWHSVYPELTAERPGLYGAVTGRGEAQVLRLSMLYALLDGTPTIGVPHLQAALAVWRYCDASARLIFRRDNEETSDPLERSLLAVIRQQPGVNRKGLHKSLGGHVAAGQMVQALARLRDKGLVRMETLSTGGRPGECWFPREQTTKAALPVFMPNSGQPINKEINPEVLSFVRPEPPGLTSTNKQDSSFVRTTAPIKSVADLFATVKAINGRLCWQGEKIGVDTPSGLVTPEILSAISAHEADLLPFMPPRPKPAPDVDPDEVLDENDPFVQDLRRRIKEP